MYLSVILLKLDIFMSTFKKNVILSFGGNDKYTIVKSVSCNTLRIRINGFPADYLVSHGSKAYLSTTPHQSCLANFVWKSWTLMWILSTNLQAIAFIFQGLVSRHSFDNQILENIDQPRFIKYTFNFLLAQIVL